LYFYLKVLMLSDEFKCIESDSILLCDSDFKALEDKFRNSMENISGNFPDLGSIILSLYISSSYELDEIYSFVRFLVFRKILKTQKVGQTMDSIDKLDFLIKELKAKEEVLLEIIHSPTEHDRTQPHSKRNEKLKEFKDTLINIPVLINLSGFGNSYTLYLGLGKIFSKEMVACIYFYGTHYTSSSSEEFESGKGWRNSYAGHSYRTNGGKKYKKNFDKSWHDYIRTEMSARYYSYSDYEQKAAEWQEVGNEEEYDDVLWYVYDDLRDKVMFGEPIEKDLYGFATTILDDRAAANFARGKGLRDPRDLYAHLYEEDREEFQSSKYDVISDLKDCLPLAIEDVKSEPKQEFESKDFSHRCRFPPPPLPVEYSKLTPVCDKPLPRARLTPTPKKVRKAGPVLVDATLKEPKIISESISEAKPTSPAFGQNSSSSTTSTCSTVARDPFKVQPKPIIKIDTPSSSKAIPHVYICTRCKNKCKKGKMRCRKCENITESFESSVVGGILTPLATSVKPTGCRAAYGAIGSQMYLGYGEFFTIQLDNVQRYILMFCKHFLADGLTHFQSYDLSYTLDVNDYSIIRAPHPIDLACIFVSETIMSRFSSRAFNLAPTFDKLGYGGAYLDLLRDGLWVRSTCQRFGDFHSDTCVQQYGAPTQKGDCAKAVISEKGICLGIHNKTMGNGVFNGFVAFTAGVEHWIRHL